MLKDAIQLWAGLLAKKKIQVFFRGTDCFATDKTITLPELSLLEVKNPTKERLAQVSDYLEALRGLVVHEVSHHLFSDFHDPEIRQFRSLSSAHDTIYNMCEDIMSERMMVATWPGTKLDLQNMNEWAHREHVAPEMWPTLGVFARTLFAWAAYVEFGEDHWYYTGQIDSIKAVVQMLSEEAEKIKQARSSRDALVVAQAVVAKLQSASTAPPKPQSKPPPKPSSKKASGSGKAGKESNNEGGAEGKKDERSKTSKGDKKSSESKAKPGGSTSSKGAQTKQGNAQPKPGGAERKGGASQSASKGASKAEPKEDGKVNDGVKIGEGNKSGAAVERAFKDQTPMKPPNKADLFSKFIKEDVRKALPRGDRYTVYSTQEDQHGVIDKVRPVDDMALTVERYKYRLLSAASEEVSGVFRRKMRNLLVEDSRPLRYHELEEGVLDMENLHRVLIPQTQGRVFYREVQQADTKDVAVTLLINQSGSMSEQGSYRCDLHGTPTDPRCKEAHQRWETTTRKTNPNAAPYRCTGHTSKFTRLDLARQTALIFGETLAALGAAFRIVGHNAYLGQYVNQDPTLYTRRGALSMPVFKEWDQQFDRVKHTLMRLVAEGNTYDGEALVHAARDISKRKEQRKIIFTLDDGIPQPLRSESQAQHAAYFKRSVLDVISAGIEVIGLGMAVPEMRQYYPTCVVIENVDDTPRVAGAELRRALTRKPKETRYT